MTLPWVVIAGCAFIVYGWGMLTIGRQFPARGAVDGRFSEAVNQAYDDGWDDCQDRSESWRVKWDSEPEDSQDDAPTVITDAQTGAGAWLGQYAELAPADERPASHTDQFRAVFAHADPFERECLLTWNSTVLYDRSRADYLREAGISEARIRELLAPGEAA